MPINSTHPLYDANIAQWKRCRDAVNGEDAIKEAGKLYLPMLSGMEGDEYDAYKTRALYYETVGRSIDGFVGAIARKPPTVVLPDAISYFLDDASGDGLNLLEFIKKLCAETILIGRVGILVDFDDAKGRPYLSVYPAESIVNWSKDQVVLSETVYLQEDQFRQKAIVQYRQLHIVEGRYTVTLWRKKESGIDGDEWAIAEEVNPTIRAKPFDTIPFFWLSSMGGTARIDRPPLLGLVNVSLSHYRNSADLEHGRHFTGLPTLYITGENPESQSAPIRVGSTSAIVLSDPASKVGYAEFSGQGLQSLENALESKEHMMAVMGAMVFAGGKKGVEAAETARIRTSGENSLLMGVVSAVETTLEQALSFALLWVGAAGEIDIDINREFVDVRMDPMELQQLVGAYQAGAITLQTLLFNMQQSEMLPPTTTIEDEVQNLKASEPQS